MEDNKQMIEYKEQHQQGMLSIENLEEIFHQNLHDLDLGVQISVDGRVWICINGIAFLRFKPTRKQPKK